MATTHPNLLLFTAALLLCAVCSQSATRCPNCGTTTVPYPLSTGPSCGQQDYKISCDAGTLKFHSLNNTYPIASISSENQRLVIQPPSFVPNTCVASDLPYRGLQLNQSLPFNVTSSNTILYLNCTPALLQFPLNCTSTSLCHVYSNATMAASACRDSPICCTYRVGPTAAYSIRVREAGCRAYTSFVNLDSASPVNRWPDPALEIQWAVPLEPVCRSQRDCDGNSTCGPDPNLSGARRCFCNGGLMWNPLEGICIEVTCHNPSGCCDRSGRIALIAGLTCGLAATLVLAAIATVLYNRQRRIKEAQESLTREREDILNAGGAKSAQIFTGKVIKKATTNFSYDRLLGAGGYGEVYKGILEDSTIVAVKCAKLGSTKGTDQVLNEVRILCQVNHKNLLRLLGCCVELEQPILVYEYIERGTLSEHLRGPTTGRLDWTLRLRIARDIADGLAYLHSSADPPIYHRDVKSSNILLDAKLNAKVSDFGLSRLARTDLSHISTCAQGTLGYLDPEYYRNYQLTDKSDVYSFGVVLLELLTAQKAIDFNRDEDDVNLAVYMRRVVEEERLMEALDPVLTQGASSLELDTMKTLAFLAVGCLEERRQNRPSMKKVAGEIEYILSIVMAEVAKD